MKYAKLKELSTADREKKLIEAKKDLLKLNGQVATGTIPKSPGQIRELKRTIAKLESLKE